MRRLSRGDSSQEAYPRRQESLTTLATDPMLVDSLNCAFEK